jgi:hypothetical protein
MLPYLPRRGVTTDVAGLVAHRLETMRHSLLVVFSSLVVTGIAAAQGAIVSPVGSAALEGDSNNVFPFGQTTPRRYMQIHADLGTTPLVITKLSFRVNASTVNYTATRTHDLEVYMGEALPTAQTSPSFLFDSNYASPKVTVLPRQLVTWGPQGQSISPGPNAFNGTMDIVLATPYVYTGTAPLIWEVAYFGSTSTGTMSAFDADGSTSLTATSTITGTGCAPSTSTTPMTHTYVVNDTAGTLLLNGTITGGPANSLALMAIGFSNPNVPVPGLCSNLYTDASLIQVLGITSGTGAYTADNPTGLLVLPNSATGLPIHTQAFVFDAGSTLPLGLCSSNGRSATVPAVGTAQVNQVTRLWNTVGGTTATTAFFTTSTVGYGLVTQFTHL